MKKMKIFTMALAALSLFSCSKENTPDPVAGKEAKVTLNVLGNGLGKSNDGAATDPQNQTYNDFLIYFFRDGGVLDGAPHYVTVAEIDKLKSLSTTTLAKKVYIIANLGANATLFTNKVRKEDDMKTVVGKLVEGSTPKFTQTPTNLWMVGGPATITFGTESNSTSGTAEVQMKFLPSKITLTVKDNRSNKDGGTLNPKRKIVDKEVVILNAGRDGMFFGDDTEKETQTDFYTGNKTTEPAPTNYVADLKFDIANGDKPLKGEALCHFYTFANDAKSKSTILAIKSEETIIAGNVVTTIYYPIQFNTTDAKNTLKPGVAYDVTITINGDVNENGGNGVTDPEETVISGSINVTVKEATWTTVGVGKTFE